MLARLNFANWCIKHFLKANLLLFYTGFGDSHVYENPALLSFGVLFFRYHNTLVQKIGRLNTNTTSAVDVFYKARQWLIASIQVGNKLLPPPTPKKKTIWKIIKWYRSYFKCQFGLLYIDMAGISIIFEEQFWERNWFVFIIFRISLCTNGFPNFWMRQFRHMRVTVATWNPGSPQCLMQQQFDTY